MVRVRMRGLMLGVVLLLLMKVLGIGGSLLVEIHGRRELLREGFNHVCPGLIKDGVDLVLKNGDVRWHWVMNRFGRYWAQDVELARKLGCFFRCHVCEVRYAPTMLGSDDCAGKWDERDGCDEKGRRGQRDSEEMEVDDGCMTNRKKT
jgi:hypothetical protein